MRREARTLLCVLASWTAAPAQAAEPAPVGARLEYHAYFLGLRVVRADATFSLGRDSYAMTFAGESEGLLDLLWSWQTEAATEGGIAHGGLRPQEHRFERRRGDRLRTLRLRYGGDGPPLLEESGPPGRQDDQRVPAEMQAGTVDYLSLMGTLIARVSDGEGCGHEAAVFNGWRRFDARFAAEPSAGAVCRFVIERRLPSGAEPELRRAQVPGWSDSAQARPESEEPLSGTIRFAPAWAGGPMVPERIDIDGWFGAATVQLAAACPLRTVPAAAVSAARAAPEAARRSCG